MGFIGLIVGFGMFCGLLWYCAIYALPLFVGVSAGWWVLNHGAGAGCIIVGITAGGATYWLGRWAISSGGNPLRWLALVGFTIAAAYAGFGMASELASGLSSPWRIPLAMVAAAIVAGATINRLSVPTDA